MKEMSEEYGCNNTDCCFESKLFLEYTLSDSLCKFEKPSFLYHYTGQAGYDGIIGNNILKFWFTRSDCFGDKTEGVQILKHYKKACKKAMNEDEIDREFYKNIIFLKPQKKKLFIENSLMYSDFECFICCFSGEENSKKMWRKYAKEMQGYKFELSSVIFDKYTRNEVQRNPHQSSMKYCKVIYDSKEKEDILYKLIINAYELYKLGKSEKIDDSLESVVRLIQYQLQVLQFSFKGKKYSFENEYRIMYLRSKEKAESEYPVVKNCNGKAYIELMIESADGDLLNVVTKPDRDISKSLFGNGFKAASYANQQSGDGSVIAPIDK